MNKTDMQTVALPVYREFISIMNYFRKDYDYFKYGLSKCNFSTFEKRGDWNLFWRLLQQYPTAQERKILFFANLHHQDCAAMHLSMQSCRKEYLKMKRIVDDPVNMFLELFGDDIKKHYAESLVDTFRNNSDFRIAVLNHSINEVAFFEAVSGLYTDWVDEVAYLGKDQEVICKVAKLFQIDKGQKNDIIHNIREMIRQNK